MKKSESSLNFFFLLMSIPLFSMERTPQSHDFRSYSPQELHEFARTQSVLKLTLRSRISFFQRMQFLGIPFNTEDAQGALEDLTDVSHNNKMCCIII